MSNSPTRTKADQAFIDTLLDAPGRPGINLKTVTMQEVKNDNGNLEQHFTFTHTNGKHEILCFDSNNHDPRYENETEGMIQFANAMIEETLRILEDRVVKPSPPYKREEMLESFLWGFERFAQIPRTKEGGPSVWWNALTAYAKNEVNAATKIALNIFSDAINAPDSNIKSVQFSDELGADANGQYRPEVRISIQYSDGKNGAIHLPHLVGENFEEIRACALDVYRCLRDRRFKRWY